MPSMVRLTKVAGVGFALVMMIAVAGCSGFGVGQATNPGSTAPIPQQTSYQIIGEVGTPFRAIISDSRSSWQVFGSVPMFIIIVNDSPPDRILVTKLANDSRFLSLELVQGLTIKTLDSTVSNYGTAVGAINGNLPAFAPAANPDVRFVVKGPPVGLFTGQIEDITQSSVLQSRVPSTILFDFPNNGNSGRVDGIFNQVSFNGVFDIDLLVNGLVVDSVNNGGFMVTLKGNG
jgi:hypothetical protein